MKILITGKNGQVGFELQRSLTPMGEIVAIGEKDCDFQQPELLRQYVQQIKPDVIVNPAAYTAVDKAESEPEKAFAINAIAPGILAEEAQKLDALMIHYSTDYVFNGEKEGSYCETDQPDPKSVYGESKWKGEYAVLENSKKALVLRTSWVFGAYGNNFATTMLRLASEKEQLNIVADQYGSPTSAALIADVTAQLLYTYKMAPTDFPFGLYHLTADGVTNWYKYTTYIVQKAMNAGKPLKLNSENIKPIQSSEYPTPAFRPKNSKLDTSKLKNAFNLNLPDWQQAVNRELTLILE